VKALYDGRPGVYYSRGDYVGVARRMLIDLVDFLAALALSALAVAAAFMAPTAVAERLWLPLTAFVWFAYFVLLKRSRFRTLGYRIAGAQIVDLTGGRPSIFSLSARLVFVLFGPLNPGARGD